MCKLKQMEEKSEKAHTSRPLSKVKYTNLKKDDLILFSYFCFCILLLSVQPPLEILKGNEDFAMAIIFRPFICQRETNCSPTES